MSRSLHSGTEFRAETGELLRVEQRDRQRDRQMAGVSSDRVAQFTSYFICLPKDTLAAPGASAETVMFRGLH